MVAFLLKAGIFVLAAGVALLLIDTFFFNEQSFFSDYITQFFYVGAGVIAVAAALWLLRGLVGLIAVKRCPRCGKPVEKNEIYCLTHLKEAVNEYKDHMHNIDHL